VLRAIENVDVCGEAGVLDVIVRNCVDTHGEGLQVSGLAESKELRYASCPFFRVETRRVRVVVARSRTVENLESR
jgi:hypothetical protein